MSRNEFPPSRIHVAIESLRDEPVSGDARARTLAALVRPTPKRRLKPALATGGVVLVALVAVLWPAKRAMAWSQVVQSTLAGPRLHQTSFERLADGTSKEVGQEWIDGNKWAVRCKLPRGKAGADIVIDLRYDGHRDYRLNRTGFGEVFDARRKGSVQSLGKRFSLAGLLGDPWLKIDKTPTEASLDGAAVLRYRGKSYEGPQRFAFSFPVVFYAEKMSGRILRRETFSRDGKLTDYSTVEYPAAIASEDFEPPTTGPRVFDLDRDAQTVRQAMAHGVPFGAGNVLRAAIQSPDGDLALLWTGTQPNPDGTLPASVAGHRISRVFSPERLNPSPGMIDPEAIFKFGSKPLYGVVLKLDLPVHGSATLRVPILLPDRSRPPRNFRAGLAGYRSKQLGIATIKDFPVIDTIPFAALAYMNGAREW